MRIQAAIVKEKTESGLFGLISFLSVHQCDAGEKIHTGTYTLNNSSSRTKRYVLNNAKRWPARARLTYEPRNAAREDIPMSLLR